MNDAALNRTEAKAFAVELLFNRETPAFKKLFSMMNGDAIIEWGSNDGISLLQLMEKNSPLSFERDTLEMLTIMFAIAALTKAHQDGIEFPLMKVRGRLMDLGRAVNEAHCESYLYTPGLSGAVVWAANLKI
jgi:hypothetical protein